MTSVSPHDMQNNKSIEINYITGTLQKQNENQPEYR
ncbi:MAG: hypothetical protein Ta2E_01760 [Mycoplasmoidaceae bacterium]|nr:MAG: hypothetical protein Ta2E_01760 [Mycoplasmoidaceae bacterium]